MTTANCLIWRKSPIVLGILKSLTANDCLQMKKRKLKEEEKKKAHEAEKAKEEQLSKKRTREERRDRYRVQDKLNKKIRRNSGS